MRVVIFTCCATLVIYHHLVYPAILRFLANRPSGRRRSTDGGDLPALAVPTIALLIPAHNEEGIISQKIANCAAIEKLGKELVEIVVALDGCTDNTNAVLASTAAAYPDLPLKIVKIEPNIGKVGVLNRIIPEIGADIVALSDASALLEADAIKKCADHFTDPSVGVVCGTYVMPDDAAPGEQSYWRYQVQIKIHEAQLAAPMGAHGAFYAFRRSLWKPLEADTINDDFMLPMRIVADGWRAVYDLQIVARELEPTDQSHDFRRRVRIGAGNLQQAIRLWRLASPKRPGLAFVFVSGKGLRSIMPFVLLAALVATLSLAFSGGIVWRALLAGEVGIALVAIVGRFLPERLPRPFHSLNYLVHGYVASGLGALLLLSGYGRAAWQVSNQGKASRPLG